MNQPPDPELQGVRALVTGGTSGLGFAMSRALAQPGARVVLTGRTMRRRGSDGQSGQRIVATELTP